MNVLARFTAKIEVDPATGCWLWTSWVLPSTGYGYFRFDGGPKLAHRVAHLLFIGPIPAGYEVDHVREWGCRHKHCVNPDHLEAVTPRVNTNRRPNAEAGRTHCPIGHPYDEANTFIDCRGKRYCLACRPIAAQRQKEKRSA